MSQCSWLQKWKEENKNHTQKPMELRMHFRFTVVVVVYFKVETERKKKKQQPEPHHTWCNHFDISNLDDQICFVNISIHLVKCTKYRCNVHPYHCIQSEKFKWNFILFSIQNMLTRYSRVVIATKLMQYQTLCGAGREEIHSTLYNVYITVIYILVS